MVVKDDAGKRRVFLSNNFALSPELIAGLYRQRWQVELFFKWIKQHLRIKVFFGISEQRGADRHIQMLGYGGVGQACRNGLLRAANLDARLFKQHQDWFFRQLTAAKRPGQQLRHVGRDV